MSIICGLGVIPYLFHFLCIFNNNPISFHLMMSFYIFINGIFYHVFFNHYIISFYIDVISNMVFIYYNNVITHNQPETLLVTLLILSIYTLNKLINLQNNNIQDFIHVFVVQWGFLYLLIKSRKYNNNYSYPTILDQYNVYDTLKNIFPLPEL